MRHILVITLLLGLAIILFSFLGSSFESESWIQAQVELGRLEGGAWRDDVARIIDAHSHYSRFWEAVAVAGLAISVTSVIGLWLEKRGLTKNDS
jgi:hypothetical protein